MAKASKGEADLVFLFMGGVHQVLHLAPIAAEISRRSDLSVHCICAGAEEAAALHTIARGMDASGLTITQMPLSWAARLLIGIRGRRAAGKGPFMAAVRWRFRKARAIIVPERTSAAFRYMGWRKPLIHFRHGAGDRAPASEARLKAFDLIVVPGEKDIERAVAKGIERARLRAAGYVKLDYLRIAPPPLQPLFDNDRPVVMYNPHFDARISSIGIARDVIERFRQQNRYNLVFAPHIRAVEDMSAAERQALEALAMPGRIIIDLGSPHLFDMHYTRAADLYLGDMSSQLYEFLANPRPVAFLNPHSADWQHNPRYAGWHLGEVAQGAQDVLATVDRAFARQQEKRGRQEEAVAFAFGDYAGAISRGAEIVLDYLAIK